MNKTIVFTLVFGFVFLFHVLSEKSSALDNLVYKSVNTYNSNVKTRIYFGTPANVENSPIVLLDILTKQNDFFSCTGTVIAKKKILTAAHCFESKAKSITATIAGSVAISGTKYYKHPNFKIYHDGTTRYDFAIVKLSSKVPDSIVPITISNKKPQIGDAVNIFGYGEDENQNVGTLRTGEMTVSSVGTNLSAIGGANTCFGDSGGPAIYTYLDKGNSVTRIVGVTSFGAEDCTLLDTTFASTLSSKARSFINKYGR